MQAKPGETGRDTQQVVTKVTEEFASIITGKVEPREGQDEEEADDKEANQE
jgi:hypothetical protein